MRRNSMSAEPSSRRLLVRSLLIGAAVVAVWLVLRAQREAAPPAPSNSAAPATAPAPAPSADATHSAAPASAAASTPAGPAANSASGEPGAASPAAAADLGAPAMSVDERQDAKIARGLASNGEGGVIVASAPPASVAAALRLQPGDVILTVNGTTVSTPADFVRLYREQGMPSELTILRAGREMHLH